MKLADYLIGTIDNRGRNPENYLDKSTYPVLDNYLIKNELHPCLEQVNRFIDSDTYKNFLRGYTYPGMVVMTLVGNGIGNVTTIPDNSWVIIQNTIGFSVSKDKLSDQFLYYYLLSINDTVKKFDRGSGQPSIRKTDILDMEVDFPSLVNQQKIAAVLSALDSKIELNTKINNNLEQQAQALLTDFLDSNPMSSKLLTDIAVIKYGKGLATKNLLDSGYPVFGGNGIIGHYSDYLYKEPQILISCRGAASGNILESLPYSYVTSNSLVVELADRKYYEFIKRFLILHPLHSYATGSAQPQITIDNLKNVIVPYPEKDELNRVTPLFESFAQKSLQIYTENKQLAAVRDALLPKLMSGEIDVSKVDISDPSCLDKSLFNCVEG